MLVRRGPDKLRGLWSRRQPPKARLQLLRLGGALGFLSGIVGIGGGVFLAPILHLTRWQSARAIAGTASAFILFNSLAGLAGQLSKDGRAEGVVQFWPLFRGRRSGRPDRQLARLRAAWSPGAGSGHGAAHPVRGAAAAMAAIRRRNRLSAQRAFSTPVPFVRTCKINPLAGVCLARKSAYLAPMPFPICPPVLGEALTARGYSELTPVQTAVLADEAAGRDWSCRRRPARARRSRSASPWRPDTAGERAARADGLGRRRWR